MTIVTVMSSPSHPFKPMEGGKRWYDKSPRAAWAIEHILSFPSDIQRQLCDVLLGLMATMRDQREAAEGVKMLGREGLLALYNSQKRRRHYDHDQHTYLTLACMSVLHPLDQQAMFDHIATLAGLIKATIEQFGTGNLHKLQRLISRVMDIYGKSGEVAAIEWLNTEGGDLPLPAATPRLEPASSILKPANVGLHTRKDK